MEKVAIKALKDFKGSESGKDLDEWKKGETYEVCPIFAEKIVRGELAEYVDAPEEEGEVIAEEVAIEDMTPKEIKAIADDMKLEYKKNISKKDLIALIASAEEEGDESEGKAEEPELENKAVESSDENK